ARVRAVETEIDRGRAKDSRGGGDQGTTIYARIHRNDRGGILKSDHPERSRGTPFFPYRRRLHQDGILRLRFASLRMTTFAAMERRRAPLGGHRRPSLARALPSPRGSVRFSKKGGSIIATTPPDTIASSDMT